MVHPFRLSFVCFLLAVSLCKSTPLRAQNFVVFDNIEALQARIARAGDTTILINFWATWCSSCVEELPCFDGEP
jgi:thiol-disulfide isomerase/thioredoxin